MKYKILVIDDDEPIHYLVKSLIGKEYALYHARNAQEAIDILAESRINLILSDIHMPGLSGLQLLKSLRADKDKKNIPILIMTSLPTVEKEQKAFELGAADFIKKDLFNTDKQRIVDLIRMKLVTNVVIDELNHSLEDSKNKLVMSLMDSALLGLFNETVDVLCSELMVLLDAEFVGMWVFGDSNSKLVSQKGGFNLDSVLQNQFMKETGFKKLKDNKSPFFSNHIYEEEYSFYKQESVKANLPAEVVIPIFSINEQGLLSSELKVPETSNLFGAILIKRTGLFSRMEFDLTSKLVIQAGSILWRLYRS